MSSIRIIATGGALAATAFMAALVGAAAQDSTPPGKPMQLLHIVEHSNKSVKPKSVKAKSVKPNSHVKSVAKRHARAETKTAQRMAPPANAPAVATIAAVVQTEPPADKALAFAEPMPSVVTIAGQSVQVTSPDDVNEIDRAADAPDRLVHRDIAVATPAAAVSALAAPASKANVAAAAPPSHSAKANANLSGSWLAQVLAALGGAIAAASAAWFLIGSAPQRTYG